MCQSEIAVDHVGLLDAVDQVSDGIVLIDTYGTIQIVNPVFMAMTGCYRDEVLGHNPRREVVNRRKGGNFYTEEMRIAPVREQRSLRSRRIGMQHETKGKIEQEQAMEASGLLREEIALLYEECTEKLVEVESDLLNVIDDTAVVNPEFINRVFRAFHSVKGAAAYLLHEPMKRLSHMAENVLGEVREGKLALGSTLAGILLRTVARLMEMADDVDRSTEIDFDVEIEDLEAILKSAKPGRGALDLCNDHVDVPDKIPVKRFPSSRLKMLVVEDELTSRIVLQDLLSKYGDCHVAVDGKEAVEAFRNGLSANRRYDLICMDVRMPVMEGTEAVRQIRSIEERGGTYSSNGVKIFMTTSVQDIKTIASSFKALCDTYLFKPIDAGQLDEHLRAFGLLEQEAG